MILELILFIILLSRSDGVSRDPAIPAASSCSVWGITSVDGAMTTVHREISIAIMCNFTHRGGGGGGGGGGEGLDPKHTHHLALPIQSHAHETQWNSQSMTTHIVNI